jgi:hypothetical protein
MGAHAEGMLVMATIPNPNPSPDPGQPPAVPPAPADPIPPSPTRHAANPEGNASFPAATEVVKDDVAAPRRIEIQEVENEQHDAERDQLHKIGLMRDNRRT